MLGIYKGKRKCKGHLTPTATRLLQNSEKQTIEYMARWNGGGKYHVVGPWNDQYIMDTNQMECTHVIATCRKMANNNEMVRSYIIGSKNFIS
uniref:Uncharacterized protein n=1 Tax=Lactuca sativa TaxID=4236 RepID=A0A9R1UCH4_LACSA|nr:hypothetical protein LSAT_V11C900468390 [Lactuca sativa]